MAYAGQRLVNVNEEEERNNFFISMLEIKCSVGTNLTEGLYLVRYTIFDMKSN